MGDNTSNRFEQDVTSTQNGQVQSERSEVKILGLLPVIVLMAIIVFRLIFLLFKYRGQKTRSPQERRPYTGTRARPSLTQQEPTIYVSPSNLPPPPKYEAMAPPTYEEVVGIHYPVYQPPVQPIVAPINAAMAQTASSNDSSVQPAVYAPPTTITVTDDSRTAVTVIAP